jgi:DtxR family Mn-dependent transcriptional regulator
MGVLSVPRRMERDGQARGTAADFPTTTRRPMAAPDSRFTRSVEDYLKAIYSLSERGGTATTNSIAEVMDVQPASVTGMVKRLAETGLLEHAPYRGVHLTPTGEREALRVVRRHRIIETYLTERLGYGWDDVHSEAERLEHAASDELVDRMASALSDPSHDPHGAPIPTAQGVVEPTVSMTLAEAPTGVPLVIRSVLDEDASALRALETHGLMPGVTLVLEEVNPESAMMSAQLSEGDGAQTFFEADLADRVFVQRHSPDSPTGQPAT